jgi:outer membrane lipoprotein-sorting protein
MRHPVVRYGLAAVLVLAAVVGFTMFRHTGNVAWAIEQSIQALDKYRAVFSEGLAAENLLTGNGSPALRPVRRWAVANAEQTAIEKYRDDTDGVTRLMTDGHKTWRYDPQANRVTIENRPYVAGEYWVGSGFLAQLKKGRDAGIITQWEETSAKDPVTRRPRVVLKIAWLAARWNGPRSLRLEFDPETKLLVRVSQWENAHWEGPASIVTEKITYYESLPDEVFEFQIPPGAIVQEQ